MNDRRRKSLNESGELRRSNSSFCKWKLPADAPTTTVLQYGGQFFGWHHCLFDHGAWSEGRCITVGVSGISLVTADETLRRKAPWFKALCLRDAQVVTHILSHLRHQTQPNHVLGSDFQFLYLFSKERSHENNYGESLPHVYVIRNKFSESLRRDIRIKILEKTTKSKTWWMGNWEIK